MNEEQTETFWGDEIQAELEHQHQISESPKLDFTRPPAQWRRLIQAQINEMLLTSASSFDFQEQANYRACLVKIAALAVAAMQAYDRGETIK